jgi:hypothetical protein
VSRPAYASARWPVLSQARHRREATPPGDYVGDMRSNASDGTSSHHVRPSACHSHRLLLPLAAPASIGAKLVACGGTLVGCCHVSVVVARGHVVTVVPEAVSATRGHVRLCRSLHPPTRVIANNKEISCATTRCTLLPESLLTTWKMKQ